MSWDIVHVLYLWNRRQGLTEESIKFFDLLKKSGKDKKKKLKLAEGLSKTHNHRGEFKKVE